MAADKYIIRVTAGPDYDMDSHTEVAVNSPTPLKISTDLMDMELNVRVQNYRGLPRGSPSTSPYFQLEPHKYNNDQYSIGFKFTPKKPEEDMSELTEGGERVDDEGEEMPEREEEEVGVDAEGILGRDLQFGNDFDHPIRDRLPPGFGTAMNIVKWWIDPGLEGDAYADRPFLYGAGLSSFNAVWVGGQGKGLEKVEEEKGGIWIEEGGDEEGMEWRKQLGVPEDGKKRMKWALNEGNRGKWVWEYGRTYGVDFYNPYVDFGEYALRLPGFNLPIMKYWDGQGLRTHPKRSHQLRYVLRNRKTGQVYLVVLFTLHLAEDINEDGSLKPAAIEALRKSSGAEGEKGKPLADHKPKENGHFDDDKALDEAKKKFEGVSLGAKQDGAADDVD
ncbi:putative f-box domain protein [Cladorrhinum sp. PSN332]|nr:putative f-box domain protein [Cladorrhinum sp. PSN332]